MASLSVAIIARNEEQNLLRALESVRSVADEVVVTDTGSTDNTVAISTVGGARVHHFDWCDDFSAAYNYCLDQIQCEWVLLIDADEQLLPASAAEVRQSIERPEALAYTVLRQDLVDRERADRYTEMLHVRLFRVHRDLRFVGRIHHQFSPPLEVVAAREGLQILPSTIRLRHFGYASGRGREKLERAARLMELELRDRPGQFYFLVELGRTWIALEDSRGVALLSEAAAILRKDPAMAVQAGGTAAMLLEHILACDTLTTGFPLDEVLAEELASRYFPRSVPLLWQRALKRYKRGQFAASAQLLEQIVALAESGEYDRLASFQPSVIEGDALLNLGVCYARLGKTAEARQCFETLRQKPEYISRATQNLAALRSAER
jgi:hypothetical protein